MSTPGSTVSSSAAAAEASAHTPKSSLARDSSARLVADGGGLVLGALSAVITARWLGPTGQGFMATLTFLATLFAQGLSLGLGDSAVVLVAQRSVPIQRAMSATVASALLSAAVGMGVFWIVSTLSLQPGSSSAKLAILVVSLGLGIAVAQAMSSHMLRVLGELVASAGVVLVTSFVTTLGVAVLVAILDLSLEGAALASVLGVTAGLAFGTRVLLRSGLSFRPRLDRRYLRLALPYGLKVEAAHILVLLSNRFDLLLVYTLAGQAAAGHYSVALTLGAIAGLAPFALAYAAFPRLAARSGEDFFELTARLVRQGTVAALATASAIALLAPFAVPLLFGDEFRASVVPAAILALGGVVWGAQWVLSRSFAARREPELLFSSVALSLVVMCALDFVLIPLHGIVGAAVAAVLGPSSGLLLCLARYRRDAPLSALAPRPADVRSAASTMRGVLSPRRVG